MKRYPTRRCRMRLQGMRHCRKRLQWTKHCGKILWWTKHCQKRLWRTKHCRQNPGKKIRMIRTFDTRAIRHIYFTTTFIFAGCYRNRGLTCFFGGQLTGLFIDRNNLWVGRRKRFAIRAAIRFYFDRCLRGRIFFHGKCGFRELNTCCFHIGIDQITISFVGVGTFQ